MIYETKNLNRNRIIEPMILFFFWVLLFTSPIILGYQNGTVNWANVWRVWRSFVPFLIIFLLNRLVLLPFLFFRNRKWLFVFVNAILIGSFAFGLPPARTMDNRRAHPQQMRSERGFEDPPPFGDRPGPEFGQRLNGSPRPEQIPPRRGLPFYLNFILISVMMVGFETGLAVTFRWMESERLRIRSEKESVSNQLAFLRNQVSPHFFMNTLNNIHSLIDLDKEKAKDTIIRLSKMMRHLLYDAEIETIPLQKELDFISHYIALMKLRYGEHVDIQLEIPGGVDDVMVPPLLFTSFIENAFKYGISATKDSYISIKYTIAHRSLIFSVVNSIFNEGEFRESTGIGITNARKRLDLLFSDQYDLSIIGGKEKFEVKLIIPI